MNTYLTRSINTALANLMYSNALPEPSINVAFVSYGIETVIDSNS